MMEFIKTLWEIVLIGLGFIVLYAIIITFINEILKPYRKKKAFKKFKEATDEFMKELEELKIKIEEEQEKEKTIKTKSKTKKENK